MGILNRITSIVKDVFAVNQNDFDKNKIDDIPIDEGISFFINNLIPTWEQVYKGNPQWGEKTAATLGMAKVICEYLAGYNTAELSISVSAKEEGQSVAAQEFLDKLLCENNFWQRILTLDETKEALGGAVIKPYNDGCNIMLNFVNAGCFIPLKYDNKHITDAIFMTKTKHPQGVYTLLEIHRMDKSGDRNIVTIENRLFCAGNYEKAIGKRVLLDTLPEYENLAEFSQFYKDTPLFVYISPGIANNKDIENPLGISRFANCLDTLEAVDKAFNELQKERIRSRKKIIVPAEWLDRRLDGEGRPRAEFDADTDVYQKMSMAFIDEQTPFAFDPSYKINDYIADINAHLSLLSIQTGLSAGSIALDKNGAVKTATEIRTENSKTFATVAKNQRILKDAIEDLTKSILFLATHSDFNLLSPCEYEVTVNFDDSVVPDRDSYISEGIRLFESGLLSQKSFLTNYLGLSENQAEKEIVSTAQKISIASLG